MAVAITSAIHAGAYAAPRAKYESKISFQNTPRYALAKKLEVVPGRSGGGSVTFRQAGKQLGRVTGVPPTVKLVVSLWGIRNPLTLL